MNSWQKFESKDTIELINIYQNTDHEDRNNAFYVLVLRFRKDLLKFCEIRCQKFNQKHEVAEDIVDDVFKSYAKKPGFKESEAKGKNIYDSFLLYLCGFAKNALTNYYRLQKRKQDGKWSDGSEKIITDLPEPVDSSPEEKVIYDFLNNLPYKHRVIYLTYSAYEKDGCYLPKKLLKELRDHVQLDQKSIRVYKKEVLDKLQCLKIGINAKNNGS